jgi:hypothetical protein
MTEPNNFKMAKTIYLLVILTMFVARKVTAQDTTSRSTQMQMQQALGMTKEQYKSYRDSLRLFDKRLTSVLKDTTLDKNTKGLALNSALQARKAYIQRHLTPDQQKKLSELNSRYAPVSPRIKNEKQHQEQLRQKGIKMTIDSTRRQISSTTH